jgi:hypothetical protein
MIAPHLLAMKLEHEVVRCIIYCIDLLEYNLPLEVEICLPEQRTENEVREHVRGDLDVLVENTRLI